MALVGFRLASSNSRRASSALPQVILSSHLNKALLIDAAYLIDISSLTPSPPLA